MPQCRCLTQIYELFNASCNLSGCVCEGTTKFPRHMLFPHFIIDVILKKIDVLLRKPMHVIYRCSCCTHAGRFLKFDQRCEILWYLYTLYRTFLQIWVCCVFFPLFQCVLIDPQYMGFSPYLQTRVFVYISLSHNFYHHSM